MALAEIPDAENNLPEAYYEITDVENVSYAHENHLREVSEAYYEITDVEPNISYAHENREDCHANISYACNQDTLMMQPKVAIMNTMIINIGVFFLQIIDEVIYQAPATNLESLYFQISEINVLEVYRNSVM